MINNETINYFDVERQNNRTLPNSTLATQENEKSTDNTKNKLIFYAQKNQFDDSILPQK